MSFAAQLEARIWARSATRRREKLVEARKLVCPCGGKKGADKVVCLACFQSAPLAMRVDAYSRVPAIARTAIRQLISRAQSKAAERLLERGTPNSERGTTFPGGEPTAACNPPQRLKALPAPAGEFTFTRTGKCKGCQCPVSPDSEFCGECLCEEDEL